LVGWRQSLHMSRRGVYKHTHAHTHGHTDKDTDTDTDTDMRELVGVRGLSCAASAARDRNLRSATPEAVWCDKLKLLVYEASSY
jgi:hypothetical protein